MKPFWKKHKIKLVLIAYAVTIAVSVRFIAVPLISGLKNKADRIQEKMIDSQVDRSRLNKIGDMEKDFQKCESQRGAIEVILDDRDKVDFITKLETIAQETGNVISLQIDEGSLGANSKPAASKKKTEDIKDRLSYTDFISMQINLEGDYSNLVSFLHKLENTANYVNILSIDVKKTDKIEENEIKSPAPAGVFPDATSIIEKQIEKKEVEFLKSTLSAVIYVKK